MLHKYARQADSLIKISLEQDCSRINQSIKLAELVTDVKYRCTDNASAD